MPRQTKRIRKSNATAKATGAQSPQILNQEQKLANNDEKLEGSVEGKIKKLEESVKKLEDDADDPDHLPDLILRINNLLTLSIMSVVCPAANCAASHRV